MINRTKVANIILMIVIGVGLFSFAFLIFTAIAQDGEALSIAIEGVATKYAVAVLFALIAGLYTQKAAS